MSDRDILARPIDIYGRTLPNRIGIQPLEGFDSNKDGSPSALTKRRYLRFAKSGAGLIWFESAAVSMDGRSNPGQMFLKKENIGSFKELLAEMDAVSEQKTFRIFQPNHSGKMSRDDDWKLLGNNITDDKTDRIIEDMINNAILASEAGFDAVDIKCCHGYYLSEILGGKKRSGRYGGDFDKRISPLLQIIKGIKEYDKNINICIRMNAFDDSPDAFGTDADFRPDPTEPVMLCNILKEHGIELINISGSGFHGFYSDDSGYDLLLAAKTIKEKVPGMAFMCTGLSALKTEAANAAARGIAEGWFDIAGFGRQALAYPGFAKDILSGKGLDPKKICICCGKCFELMDPCHTNTGCVVRDREIYRMLRQIPPDLPICTL